MQKSTRRAIARPCGRKLGVVRLRTTKNMLNDIPRSNHQLLKHRCDTLCASSALRGVDGRVEGRSSAVQREGL